ncbi:MAG: acylneuraminate cytidylyltransferase family protein [Desulfobulbaceae bacterium]|nr:acylneuraminate cytidylyltransferase family protein [Desulfobulbaceae bacterium]
MINNKKVLAIIPARGGSKGIPRKNLQQVNGKPLIAWTIEEAKKSRFIDRLILSSENKEIIETAIKWGCEVPFIRPDELATDEASTVDVILHTMNILAVEYDYIVLLQPTSPLRRALDIDRCIDLCLSQKAPACVSVTEADKSPYWMFQLGENKTLQPILDSTGLKSRRQDLPKIFVLNGAVYVAEWSWFLENKTFLTKDTLACIMDKERSLDIDTEIDFRIFKSLAESKED